MKLKELLQAISDASYRRLNKALSKLEKKRLKVEKSFKNNDISEDEYLNKITSINKYRSKIKKEIKKRNK